METETFNLPAFTVGYFFYGDHGDLNDEEIAACDEFMETNGLSWATSASDYADFSWSHDMDNYFGGADCLEITFIKK